MTLISERQRYNWLDAIRFLAALLVVLEHSRGVVFLAFGELTGSSQNPCVMVFFALARLGTEAVIVFFVLSGFLVGGISLDRLLKGTFRTGDYIIDRLVRLLLPLVPSILLTVLVEFWSDKEGVNLEEVVGNLFFLQGSLVPALSGNEPLWSLAYEFWFYALVAGMGFLAVRSFIGFAILLFVCIVFQYLDPTYLFAWLLGAAAYFVPAARIGRWVICLALAAFGFGVALMQAASIGSKHMDLGDLLPGNMEILMVAAGSALIVRYVSVVRSRRTVIARAELEVGRLAVFSYTLYLTHYPLLEAFRLIFSWQRLAVVDRFGLMVYVALVLGLLCSAWLLYLCFESRTDAVKSWIKHRVRSRRTNLGRELDVVST